MTDLKAAMQRVDSVGGAGEIFESRRPVVLPAIAGLSISDVAAERAGKIAKMRKLACAAVSLAMKEGGHPEHCFTEASATAIWTVAELLTAAMDARPIQLPAELRQASSPEDRAKADAVAKALAGEAAA